MFLAYTSKYIGQYGSDTFSLCSYTKDSALNAIILWLTRLNHNGNLLET